MKNSACAAVIIGMCAWVTSSVCAQPCYDDGYQLGIQETEAFCNVFENMFHNDVVGHPTHVSLKLCTDQLIKSCLEGMSQSARDHFPLCTWMIHNGWVNGNGENAAIAWAAWQRASCNVGID